LYIELADYLSCPEDHEFVPCVVAPTEMVARSVISGAMGCPVCRREYPIQRGRVVIGPKQNVPLRQDLDPDTVRALVGLESPGGYVILAGEAVRLVGELGAMETGFVGLNASDETQSDDGLSLIDSDGPIPLKDRTVRGVVLDANHATASWIAEAGRVVLPGQRVVVATEDVPANDLEQLAAGHGFWVGRRR
jgi:uncharacterized protein YbaR (Trm112 family)